VLGFSKHVRLGYAHIALLALACILIEVACIVNIATLAPRFITESCNGAGFGTETCISLPTQIMYLFYVVIVVAPIVSAVAVWFSIRFVKMLKLSQRKYFVLDEEADNENL
jgi:hypothetical protein